MAEPLLHVVLYQPEIPQNTGNIGRTCVAVGAKLWLIAPLGFRLDDRHLRRAGLDYWPLLEYEVLDGWEQAQARLPDSRVWYVTKTATRTIWDAQFSPGDILLFGNESSGLPQSIRSIDASSHCGLPMREEVRSLNLASTANTLSLIHI